MLIVRSYSVKQAFQEDETDYLWLYFLQQVDHLLLIVDERGWTSRASGVLAYPLR